MQPYFTNGRRRIMRRFNFNRILAFVMIICFLIALLLVLSSVKIIGAGKSVKPRTLYFVTVGQSLSQSQAAELAHQCKSKGGAGYILTDGTFKVAAALYIAKSAADSVETNLTADGIATGRAEIVIPKLKIQDDEVLTQILSFSAYTLVDRLYDCAMQLAKKEISEALAVKQCELLISAAKTNGALSAEISKQAISATLVTMLDNVVAALKNVCKQDDYPLVARMRYALCSLSVNVAQTFETIKQWL